MAGINLVEQGTSGILDEGSSDTATYHVSLDSAPDPGKPLPPQPRAYPGVNWMGLKTLYLREVRRFMKVGTQTLAAPVVTALLYMLADSDADFRPK